ncbi:uncharacterized protein BYT42DRAFT_566693 [Radiomyces spectabilis]|uniref:uncharacterized protein n=1 Tax=Radiomyces spectabilis TaxID=64574 RepID=UPI0022203BD1|nr:uncharacterized protein BYT42DRAFT_566693 [Radiomyces spectabilis]KAI8381482.1 hypothetical protein BYT42DRAFT_566693 [Radiomyces spectabilis]
MRVALIARSKAPAVPRFFKEPSLTLNHFLIKSQVRSLYRQILRCTKGLDKHDAKELRDWARSDFERYRHETDLDKIRSLLSSGKHQMHSLQSSVSLAQAGKR